MGCEKQYNYVISLIKETKRRKHIEQEFGQQKSLFHFLMRSHQIVLRMLQRNLILL